MNCTDLNVSGGQILTTSMSWVGVVTLGVSVIGLAPIMKVLEDVSAVQSVMHYINIVLGG